MVSPFLLNKYIKQSKWFSVEIYFITLPINQMERTKNKYCVKRSFNKVKHL